MIWKCILNIFANFKLMSKNEFWIVPEKLWLCFNISWKKTSVWLIPKLSASREIIWRSIKWKKNSKSSSFELNIWKFFEKPGKLLYAWSYIYLLKNPWPCWKKIPKKLILFQKYKFPGCHFTRVLECIWRILVFKNFDSAIIANHAIGRFRVKNVSLESITSFP